MNLEMPDEDDLNALKIEIKNQHKTLKICQVLTELRNIRFHLVHTVHVKS